MTTKNWAVINKATGDTVDTYASRTMARNNKTDADKVVQLTKPSAAKKTVTTTAKPIDRVGSKKETARQIYTDMKATGAVRKDVMVAFTDPKGPLALSNAGASTYYQNLNGGKW